VPDQLDIFGSPGAAVGRQVEAAEALARVVDLGSRVPGYLRFGTSSWSFPGWKNIVYKGEHTTQQLSRLGLGAYSAHPLLRTVGIDRSFYGPVRAEEFARYAEQVGEDFRFLVKAHAECTLARFGHDKRWGERAGQMNARFLNPNYAREFVVEPFVEGLGAKGGVLLFQFSPQALAPLGGAGGFADRLHDFFTALERLPDGAVYAVELRNEQLMTPRYFDAIADLEVEHCVNALPGMPEVDEQIRMRARSKSAARSSGRGALVIRWMLNRSHAYQGAKLRYEPFDALIDEDVDTRGQIAQALSKSTVPSYTVVNNKAEGSSPLSILRLVESILS